MAETIQVECGACQKRFRITPNMVNRQVACPHCKTPTIVEAPTAAQQAAADIFGPPVEVPPLQDEAPPVHSPRSSAHKPGPALDAVFDQFAAAPAPAAHKPHRPSHVPSRSSHRPHGRSSTGHRSDNKEDRKDPAYATHNKNKNTAVVWGVILGAAVLLIAVLSIVMLTQDRTPPAAPPAPSSKVAAASLPQPVRPPDRTAATTTTATTTAATDTLGPAAPKSAAAELIAERAAEAAGATSTAPAATGVGMQTESGISIVVERLIGGFAGERLTYAVGRVTNGSMSLVHVLKVTVPISETSGGDEIGKAEAVLMNIPPGATVPLVAEWTHEEGQRGVKNTPTCQVDPPGITQGLPAIAAEDAVPLGDANNSANTGRVTAWLTNKGVLPVPQVEMFAILIGEDGKIIGATRGTITIPLAPGKATKAAIPWSLCPGRLVTKAELWAQAKM
jgi:hypothetical protein